MFNQQRLSLARRRRGITKKRLAELAGVSTRTIVDCETGSQEPTAETTARIASALYFPLEFFFGEEIEEIGRECASFRALSRMSAGKRDAALAAGALAIRLSQWIDQRFELPRPNIPDVHESMDSEMAAQELRTSWGLGARPISNVIHLLESRGIRVFSLVEDCQEVDAISAWNGSIPFIFLNTRKSAERTRFDAAHELGHLVLHQHGMPSGRLAEEQANAFAAAFLMPKDNVLARSPMNPSLASIFEGKHHWGVSAMAYAYRLHKIGMLSDWYYHQLMRTMSTLGYRSAEPEPRPHETSQLLRKVLDHLRSGGITKADIARDLQLYPDDLDKLIFGLTLTGVNGSGGGSSGKRGDLRLVPF